MNLKKEQIDIMPEFFERYIHQVPDMPVIDALQQCRELNQSFSAGQLERLGDQTYAEGKWTIKDILQHLIDMERVLAYRALWIARNGGGSLPSVDEDSFAIQADARRRDLSELLDEFAAQRTATIFLFHSFTEEMGLRSGIAADKHISVLALGFVIAGHTVHHIRIMKERYLPLLPH
jgi:hypothetical protein